MIADTFAVCLQIRVNASVNKRSHWRQKARIAHCERLLTGNTIRSLMSLHDQVSIRACPNRIRVTLKRIGKRLLDDDNLQGAFKHVRDGVADALGIDDGSLRYRWVYVQEKGPKYGVEIEIQIESGKPKGRGKACEN